MAGLKLMIASVLLVHLASPSPQFFRFPTDGRSPSSTYRVQQPYAPQAEDVRKREQSPLETNHTKAEKHIEPVLSTLDAGDELANSVRNSRQVLDNSIQSQFPKIYKVDDFIIIANPKVRTPPACVPAPQPMFYPSFPRPAATPSDDGLNNRLAEGRDGGEPSRCVWAIVACCSPGSRNIRYSCFELLGCPGAFWDVNPCEERVVMAAANSALQFYTTNATSTPSPTNS